jgi:low temperature requirement protein LtrA
MLGLALALPQAFGDDAILFGLSFLAVRVLHVGLYAYAGKDDPDLLRALLRVAPTEILGALLLVGAAFLSGDWRIGVWVLALAVDYLDLGPLVALFRRRSDLRPSRARARRRRHAGQARPRRVQLSAPTDDRRNRLLRFRARDDPAPHHDDARSSTRGRALRRPGALPDRTRRFPLALDRTDLSARTLGAAVLVVLIPAALDLPAVAALAIVSTVCSLVVAYEAVRYREHRSRIRHPELTG